MTADASSLTNRQEYTGPEQITVANGNTLPISNIGDLHLSASSSTVILKDILHVPNLKANLLSVSHFVTDHDCVFLLDQNGVCIKDHRTEKLLCKGPLKGSLFSLQARAHHESSPTTFAGMVQKTFTLEVWHKRLGHSNINPRILHHLVKNKVFPIVCKTMLSNCVDCSLNKSSLLSFSHLVTLIYTITSYSFRFMGTCPRIIILWISLLSHIY